MIQMPGDLFARYVTDPLGHDAEVRARLKLPEDKYYTVSVWPEHLAGRVFVDEHRSRVVKSAKISKSNQP